MFKLFPNLLSAVARTLVEIFLEAKYADKAIERMLKSNPKWGSRDRAFIAETTYDIVRNYRYCSQILGKKPQNEAEMWEMTAIWLGVVGGREMPDWEEFSRIDWGAAHRRKVSLRVDRRSRESLPNWLDAIAVEELGEPLWEATIKALNEPARLVIRTNTLRVQRSVLKKMLADEGHESEEIGPDALVLAERANLFKLAAFQEGFFEVQDYSSQQVGPFLAPEQGHRVIDACAGGGGKTLHLAALMSNKGRILALDNEDWKLVELQKRARRAMTDIVETRWIDSTKVIKRLENTADRLLLDVPCSGLGVLRRNPDAKWKLDVAFLEKVRGQQAEILSSYSRMVKPGGRLVYATCSIMPSENERQVAAFLASERGADFEFLEERKILPQAEGFDGFYMAALMKKADKKAAKPSEKKIAAETEVLPLAEPMPIIKPKKTTKKTAEKPAVAEVKILEEVETSPIADPTKIAKKRTKTATKKTDDKDEISG